MTAPHRSSGRQVGGEFGRFLIAGVINTATTYALYLLLLDSIGYLWAYSVGYAAGIVVSYFLNTFFVFRTAPGVTSFVRFPLVYVIQYVLGAAVLWLFVDRLGVSRELGLALSIAATVPVTFAASRLVVKGSDS